MVPRVHTNLSWSMQVSIALVWFLRWPYTDFSLVIPWTKLQGRVYGALPQTVDFVIGVLCSFEFGLLAHVLIFQCGDTVAEAQSDKS